MLVGKRISGRYKILDVIGGGGMSNVYLAHDMILDRDVAIKILHYNFSNEQEMHRRFQREALSATSLTHPNIVSIYDVGEDGDMHYLVMEYVKGQTLKQYIQKYAPLAPVKCVNIMKQLTSAIASAHQNQIIHRDIKPQNILMDESGNVKITDFGIAMALEDTSFTRTNSVLGTVHYLSPEQARGGTATKKSDIYSLGIVLYELLTGELPFSGESAVAIALKHLQSETPSVRSIVPSIPQSLENVVLKATAKDPLHRYLSVEEMREDLETVLSDERSHETKFIPPIDDDATKLIPVIKETEIEGTQDLEQTKAIPVKEKDSYNDVKSEKNGKRKNKVLIFIGLLLSLLLIFLIVLFLYPDLFSEKRYEVPDVTNQDLEKAIRTLENAGFVIGDQAKQSSDEIDEDKIISTNPEAGKERIKGTEIDLTISEGPKKTEIINYVGKDIAQVKRLLEKQGFNVNVKESYSDETEGTIIQQSPEEGESVIAKDTTITLTISKGVKQELVASLLGYDKTALDSYAKTSGFNIHIGSEEYSETVPNGQVISQTPKAGTKVAVGSKIVVVLSKGKEQKSPKSIVKSVKIEIPYEPEVEGEPQQVRIYIQDRTRSIKDVEQEFQLYSTQQKNLQVQIEEGQEAIYKVERDGKIIINEKIAY